MHASTSKFCVDKVARCTSQLRAVLSFDAVRCVSVGAEDRSSDAVLGQDLISFPMAASRMRAMWSHEKTNRILKP
jgi:hypothetical protein